MRIDALMVAEGSADFYNARFRYALEAHIPYFRKSPATYLIPVTPINTVVYKNDLFGFLTEMGIRQCYHWIIMRVNGYFSPFSFGEEVRDLMVPSAQELEQIRQSWNVSTVIRT